MLPPFDPDFATVADHARYYRSIGWQVIPGYNPRPKTDDPGQRWKAPALPQWRTLQAELVDDATFEGFFGPSTRYARPDATNLGILTGECSGRLVCLDLDSYKGPEAMQWWRGLMAIHNNGMDIETVTQITGGGGLQLLFRAPPGWMCSIGTSSLNVDVRGHGGFFVVAPSLHDSGNAYRWQEGCAPWDIGPADMPEWLCEAVDTLLRDFSRKAPGSSPAAPRGTVTPTPAVALSPFGKVVDGREDLMTRHVWGHVVALRRDAPMKPAGKEMDEAERAGFQGYVGKVKSRLTPSGEAPEVLLEREGRGWSLWREKWAYAVAQWDTKVREEADKPHPKPRGSEIGEPISLPRHDPETGEIIDDDEFAAAKPAKPRIVLESFASIDPNPPPGQWLVRDLLPTEGLAVIYGPPKNYKSFVALDLALSIAAGRQWAGKRVKPGPVVYIAAEGANGLRNRIRAYKQRGDMPADLPFYLIAARPNLGSETSDGPEFVAAITAVVPADTPPVAIFIDTVARSLGDGEENGAGMMAFINNAEDLAATFHALGVAIHHEGKNGDNGMRGHSSLPGAMVAGWRVKKTDTLQCTITVEAAKDGEDGFGIEARLAVVDLGMAPDTLEPVKTLMVESVSIASQDDLPMTSVKASPSITPAQRALMRAVSIAMERHGIELRPMGPNSTLVRAVERDNLRAAYFEVRGDELDAESLRKDFSRVLAGAIKREALYSRQRGQEVHVWVA